MAVSFAARLNARISNLDTRVCLGLDPRPVLHASTHPDAHDGDPARVARSVVGYFRAIIESTSDLVACYKPQVAFFEALGIPGLIALAQLQADIRELGVPLLTDAKRGDMDTTAEAYAQAWLADGVFATDALTVNPYLGTGSLVPFSDRALQEGRGLFILVRTSNAGGEEFQELRDAGGTAVFEHVADMVNRFGEEAALLGATDPAGYSHAGAVVGATLPVNVIAGLRRRMPRAIFLMPGYGAQGGDSAAAAAAFDEHGFGAVLSASRSLTYFDFDVADHAGQARAATLAMRDELNAAIAARHA